MIAPINVVEFFIWATEKNYAIKKIENTKLILELNNSKTTSKLIPQHVALK